VVSIRYTEICHSAHLLLNLGVSHSAHVEGLDCKELFSCASHSFSDNASHCRSSQLLIKHLQRDTIENLLSVADLFALPCCACLKYLIQIFESNVLLLDQIVAQPSVHAAVLHRALETGVCCIARFVSSRWRNCFAVTATHAL
jgi:hypothetical protein